MMRFIIIAMLGMMRMAKGIYFDGDGDFDHFDGCTNPDVEEIEY